MSLVLAAASATAMVARIATSTTILWPQTLRANHRLRVAPNPARHQQQRRRRWLLQASCQLLLLHHSLVVTLLRTVLSSSRLRPALHNSWMMRPGAAAV
uniref:Putative secreted peptide n=1 Tax=Anopheles braziliensis TaxID=58242 RepID=A0A2M3ZPW6_9DIPT